MVVAVVEARDIYRSAGVLIREHGSRAEAVAERRARQLGKAGDLEGRDVWLRISQAVEVLQDTKPGAGVMLQ